MSELRAVNKTILRAGEPEGGIGISGFSALIDDPALSPEENRTRTVSGGANRYRTTSVSQSESQTLLARSRPMRRRAGLVSETVVQIAKQQITQNHINRLEQKVLRVEYVTTAFGLSGTVLAVFENELGYQAAYHSGNGDLIHPIRNILKCIMLALTILLVGGLLYYHYLLSNLSMVAVQRKHSTKGNLPQTVLLEVPRKFLLVELMVCMCTCPPFFDKVFDVEFLKKNAQYRLESFLLLVNLARMYLGARCWRDRQACQLKRALPVLQQSGVSLSTKFIVKRTLEERPAKIFVTIVFLLLMVSAYAIRVGEIPLYQQHPEHLYFWTNMWLVVTTITTVGFGDTYPRTHIGRAFCGFAMISSMGLVSLMTASLTKAIGYTKVEARVAHIVNKQEWREDLEAAAARLIQLWWRDSRRPGCIHPRRFTNVRDIWQKANRRHIRAIQSEATVEKGLDGVIDKVRTLGKVTESQMELVEKMEDGVKHVARGLSNRFNALEGKVAALRHGLTDMRQELRVMSDMGRDLKNISHLVQHSKVLSQATHSH
mmetsp:Transcript_11332/g.25780  ORF Transcript_11332/g.25780 Transcript_11332/m.25780 type:complete len:543 (+) Transcript_11332:49-1677(+)